MAKSSADTFQNSCEWSVFLADLETAFPNASTAPGAGWLNLGYCKDDPVPEVTQTITTVKPSNACAAVAQALTASDIAVDLTPSQITQLVVEGYFGAGAWATSGSGKAFTPSALAVVEKAMILELVDKTKDRTFRICAPKAGIAPNGALALPTDDLISMPIRATVLSVDGDRGFTLQTSWDIGTD